MTGERKAPIPFECRRAASRELLELANTMMRAASGLICKSARVLDPDPKTHGRMIGILRTFASTGVPGSDQMDRIEAILTGVPEDQCRSERETKRQKRKAEHRVRTENWRREFEAEKALKAHERAGLAPKPDGYLH